MRTTYPALAGLSLLISVCAGRCQPATAPSNWNARDHIPLDQFVIQAHRGAGDLLPENTLEAYELGWKLGTWPECDVRTTKDGVIVLFHDGNFSRTVKDPPPDLVNKGVKDITYAELSKLDVGGWKGEQFQGRHVSRVSEVLKLMIGKPERKLYLDIKNVDLNQLATEVRAAKVARQVAFCSTKYDLVCSWKKLVPESMTLHWMGGTEEALAKRFEKLRETKFAYITQLQIHVSANTNSASAEPFVPSRQFLRAAGNELRTHGILFEALPWGANKPETYWQLLDLGVMAFATDFPDVAVKAVRDYYAKAAK